VTSELCGHWEHDGACRWPHNNAVDTRRRPARFRTIFVASDAEAAEVFARIDSALRASGAWRTSGVRPGRVGPLDRALAHRLTRGPRRRSE
jgi:hypothetical protein